MLEQLFMTLLVRSLTAGVLIGAIIILRPLLMRISRTACCALWCLAAFRLVCPVSIPSVFSLFGLFSQQQSATTAPSTGGDILIWQVIPEAMQGEISPVIENASPTEIFSVLWIVGVVLLVLFWVVSYLRMCKCSRRSVFFNDGYWRSASVASPMVFGIIHPRILIPYDIEEPDIPYILAHEQSHISRRDNLTKPLAFLIVAVYWFNPLVWLAYVLYCRDIEFACDARALRRLGETPEVKARYTRILLRNSVSRQDRSALTLPFGGKELKRRLRYALSYKKPKFAAMLLVALLFTTLAVCFLTDPVVKAEYPAPIEPDTSVSSVSSVSAEPNVSQPALEVSEAEMSTETSSETSESDISEVRAEIKRILKSETTYEILEHFRMTWGDEDGPSDDIIYTNVGTEDGTVTLLFAYGGGSYPNHEDYGAELLTIRIPAGKTVVCPLDPGYSYEGAGYILVGATYGTMSYNIFIDQDAFRINNITLTEYLKNCKYPTLSERTFG